MNLPIIRRSSLFTLLHGGVESALEFSRAQHDNADSHHTTRNYFYIRPVKYTLPPRLDKHTNFRNYVISPFYRNEPLMYWSLITEN